MEEKVSSVYLVWSTLVTYLQAGTADVVHFVQILEADDRSDSIVTRITVMRVMYGYCC